MTRVAVLGARGRMGSEVVRAVEAADDLELVATVDADDPLDLSGAEVAVDFTHPDAVMGNLRACVEAGVAFHFKQWGGPVKSRTGRELDGRTWDQTPIAAE